MKTILVILFLLSIVMVRPAAALNNMPGPDTSVSAEIRMQLGDFKNQGLFHFPKTVFRFYRQHSFQPVWVNPLADQNRTREAVLMLNCVLQFGLCHSDYHSKEIDYARLHVILEHPETVNNNEKARYELMITDALIAFMNHLHYGKLNPYFSASKIDAGVDTVFRAGRVLAKALRQPHFMSSIVGVQPTAKEYSDLEDKMRAITQFQEDCYALPDSNVRKMAINLERMRWAATFGSNYIQVNIPSYTLTLYRTDTDFTFKAIVGNAFNPTPALNSLITDFTTASKLKISRRSGEPSGNINPKGVIYFWFKNSNGISINGRPERELFNANEKALTKGGIKVEYPEKLAELLLEMDRQAGELQSLHQAIADYAIKDFTLSKPVPFKITYITCEVRANSVVNYKDIYNLDKKLEMALYNTDEYLVSKQMSQK